MSWENYRANLQIMDAVIGKITSGKTESKMTEKAVEEKLHRLTQSRKAKIDHLTSQANQIESLMEDDSNMNAVKQKLRLDYQDSFGELCKINDSLKQLMHEEELMKDQSSWYEPNASRMHGFMQHVELWIKAAEGRVEQSRQWDAGIQSSDSVSISSRKRGSEAGSKVSNTSSAHLKAEMERATLLPQATALKQRQDLERQEADLKANREQLELQTAIAASDAKLKVLEHFENERLSQVSHAHAMTIKSGFIPLPVGRNPVTNTGNGHDEFVPMQPRPTGTQQSTADFVADDSAAETLFGVMARQNTITEVMVKQQKMITLPPLDIPTFSGDPLDYNTFVRAFEHGVESRTESPRDRLYVFRAVH